MMVSHHPLTLEKISLQGHNFSMKARAVNFISTARLTLFLLFICTKALASSQLTVESTPFSFFETGDVNYFVRSTLQSRIELNKHWIAHLGVSGSFADLENSNSQRYFINPTGTRLIYRNSTVVFAMGFNSHDYTISQFMGPLDYVDQRNYWDPLHSERLADFSLRTSFKTGKVRWRVTYIPYRLKPVYPGQDSYWLPRNLPASIQTTDQNVIFPENPTYGWKDTEVFSDSNKNNFAIIGEYENKSWLWRWGYYNGLDVAPNFHLELNLQNIDFNNFETIYPIFVIPVQNKIQQVGFGVRYITPIKWRLFFENTLSSGNPDDLVAEDYLYSTVFGLEWGIPFAGDILYGLFQGFYTVSSEEENHLGVLPPLRKAAMAALLWKKPRYELSLALIYSFSIDIALTQFSSKLFITDHLFAQANINLFNGATPELISGIKSNDLIHAGVGYKVDF